MAAGISRFCGAKPGEAIRLPWEDPRLLFVVREPFVSRHSQASLVMGMLQPGEDLSLQSLMPSGGVILAMGWSPTS
jgi:hypothetical protein